jgi:hypothetical protein
MLMPARPESLKHKYRVFFSPFNVVWLFLFRESRALSQTSCWGEGKQRREKRAEQKASFDAQFASAIGRGNIALVF